MRNCLAAFALASLLFSPNVFAAKFFYAANTPGFLELHGEIVPGDYDRMLWLISLNIDQYLATNEVILASDGGDVAEALKIAKLVNELTATVRVSPEYGRCVSACFLIFASANVRYAEGENVLGIHRPYLDDSQMARLSPTEARKTQTAILKVARSYLEENEVPEYLIEEMFRRASNDIYWLSPQDIAQVGVHSHWFDQYLVAKCGQTGAEDTESYRLVIRCARKVTKPDARKALLSAMGQEAARKRDSPELSGIRASLTVYRMMEKLMAEQMRCAEDPSCPAHDQMVCMKNHNWDGSQCGT